VTRSDEASETRSRILALAGGLFAERGFDAVSVADIASTAGISTGLIYYHFKDKQTLYETAVREGVHLLEDAAVATLSSEGEPAERLQRFVASYMRLLEGQPALMRLLIRSVSDLGGPAPGHVLMRSAAIVDRLRTVIEEGMAAGAFRQVDAQMAATALFALINTLMTARVLDTPLGQSTTADVDTQAAFMTDLFLKGIAECS